ncbi:MAG: hypothetical protein ABWZ98_04960 [Nakamurella sp.]
MRARLGRSALHGGGRDRSAERCDQQAGRRAAFVLVLLAPLVAELAFGITPVSMAWLVLFWLPIYGAGILLIRELVVRNGRGWLSIVVLGVAYEIVEDGIGLQALTSPQLYGAAGWGARVLGFNLPYWEANVIYHVVFSAVIPILLVQLAFPGHRGRPYLTVPGLAVTAIIAALGVGVLRVTVPPAADPGYSAPLTVTIGCAAVALLLGVIALRWIPPSSSAPPAEGAVPHPAVLVGLGAVATIAGLALLFPFAGAAQPSFTSGWWVLLPMTGAAVLAAGSFAVIRVWSRRRCWSDQHALGLAAGAMVAHSLAGLTFVANWIDRVGLLVIVAITIGGCLALSRRLRPMIRC